jgi:hypothetical protein
LLEPKLIITYSRILTVVVHSVLSVGLDTQENVLIFQHLLSLTLPLALFLCLTHQSLPREAIMNHSPIIPKQITSPPTRYFTIEERAKLGLPNDDEINELVGQCRLREIRDSTRGIVAGTQADYYVFENPYCSCTFCTFGGTGYTGECADLSISDSIPI